MTIRPCTEAALPALTAIYNHAIAHTTAVFSEDEVTVTQRREWWQQKQADGFPVLVAEMDGVCAGFASYGWFRPWPGYRFTVENAVYVSPDFRGRGIASALMQALIDAASAAGYRQMIAGIAADNEASILLHEKCGFVKTGYLPRIAWKFGGWLDLQFMQRELG